jgi:hypothetical protein
MRPAGSYGEPRSGDGRDRGRVSRLEGCDVNNTAYAGPGVEIEEDIVRLRRRKLEYEANVARDARRAGPRPPRLWTLVLTRALSAVSGRRR